MEARPRTLENYLTEDGCGPFEEWIRSLRDGQGRGIIHARLGRVRKGNFGDCYPVGEGVHELKIDFGPGYRVYFGEDGDTVVLLGGGTKRSQDSDIKQAKERWRDYCA